MSTNIKYIENSILELPIIKNGIYGLGDLWDCHTSKRIGFNLFGKQFSEHHLISYPIKDFEYELIHLKSSEDKCKSVKISGSLALELLSGLIKVEGSGSYDHQQNIRSSEERLTCQYHLRNYHLALLPNAKEVIDEEVSDMLLNDKLKATHVVRSIIIGAHVDASITIKHLQSSTKEDINANVLGKLVFGPVSATVKANLGWLDNKYESNSELRITIHSNPPIGSQPSTIKEMFNAIENMHKVIATEKHYTMVSKDITGVPIGFELVPINQFLDVKVERLYLQLKDEVMDKFQSMLNIIRNFEALGCVRNKIIDDDFRLRIILLDQKSPLTQEITEYEKSLNIITLKYFGIAMEALKQYKVSHIKAEGLLKIVNDFGREFNVMDVYTKIMQFVERGENELISIHDKDAVPVREYISYFTNRNSLDQWYNTERNIKILLSTSGSSPEGTFMKLFNISRELHSLGIEIGIALPSISGGTSLSIKINENSKHYQPEDISYVLSIIGVIIGSGSAMEILFHTLNASLFEISLPLNKEEMKDINKLIDIVYISKIVYISPSRIDTLQQITENDGAWKFLIPLEALYTSLDATEKLRTLTTDSIFKGKNCKWIVGSLGIVKTYSAPLLIALHNSKIQAICFDNLDLLIFTKLFNLLNEDSVLETHFQILSNVTNRKSFYSDRVYYAIKLNDIINFKESPNINKDAFTMQSFDEKCDPKLKDAIKLTRWIISENDSLIVMNLIGLTVHSLPNINDILSFHLWSESNCTLFGKNMLEKHEWNIVKNSLQVWFRIQSPFLSKISFAIDIIDKFTTNGNITDENELIANNALQAILDDKECTEVMKNYINLWMKNDRTHRFTEVKKVLTDFIKVQSNSDQYFHLRNVISLISELLVDSNNGINKYDLLAKYIERIKLNNEMYPNANEKLNDLMKRRLLHPLVTQLYKYSHDRRLFFIHREFDQLSDISDSNSIIRLLTNLYDFDQINEKQWIDIWLNEQFLYLIREHLTDIRIQEKIAFSGCKNDKIPHYIPEDIAQVIKRICVEQSQQLDLTKIITNLEEFLLLLRRIFKTDCFPNEFSKLLVNSLRDNTELEQSLINMRAIPYWDESQKLFSEPWDLNTIHDVIEIIENHINPPEDEHEIKPIDMSNIQFELITQDHNESDQIDAQTINTGDRIILNKKYQTLIGTDFVKIMPNDFVKVTQLLPRPLLSSTELTNSVNIIMPYLIQKVKMWGCDVLNAENIAELIKDNSLAKSMQTSKQSGPKFIRNIPGNSAKTQNTAVEQTLINEQKLPLSRLNLLVCLLSKVDNIVAQDILRIMSLFSISLPLIIPDMSANEQSFTILLPLLIGPKIKWESEPGVIIENNLFSNEFRLIVAIRLGDNTRGKSTILNQMLANNYTFSSCGEPGAKRGPPILMDGCVEFIWLTQETCSAILWKRVIEKHYINRTKNEVILLANFHGDVTNHLDSLRYLNELASSFVVFIMPQNEADLETKWNTLCDVITDTSKLVYIMVDPKSDCEENDEKIINTAFLSEDTTLEKVRNLFDEALKLEAITIENILSPDIHKTLKLADKIETQESNILLQLISSKSCQKVKEIMKLQRGLFSINSCYDYWENTTSFRDILTKFVSILNLPLNKRRHALLHLDRIVSQLSSEESLQVRNEVESYKEELRRTISLTNQNVGQMNKIKGQIKRAEERVDSINLGLEHFYRELGKLYEIILASGTQSINPSVMSLPNSYAQLFTDGFSIELLDGDVGQMTESWLTAICDKVSDKFPDLRVFVVSILGLQSSGKSTLLNALFGCKFAVSVGRCTRGLFMRLLFFDDILKEKLNADAILLIDTEGLGAPEKVNDTDCEKKDRLMATFAMGVSNLTLINVLGEYMRDLTEILQIAIVAMSRLEKAQMSPDILLIQHLIERNTLKSASGVDQFCEALQKAIDLAEKKDMEMGIRNSKCLINLMKRIQDGQLLKQFRPFKNGASVNSPPSKQYHEDVVDLYKSIIDSCYKSGSSVSFKQWYSLVQSFWNAVVSEQFAVRFKSVKEIYEFIELGDKIAKVKDAIDSAFNEHNQQIKKKIRVDVSQIQSGSCNKQTIFEYIGECMQIIPNECKAQIGESCQKCQKASTEMHNLFQFVSGKECETETKKTILAYNLAARNRNSTILSQMVDALVVQEGCSTEFIDIINKCLRECLKSGEEFNDNERKGEVNKIWEHLVVLTSNQSKVIPVERQIKEELGKEYQTNIDVCKGYNQKTNVKLEEIEAIDLNWYQIPLHKVSSRLVSSKINSKQLSWLESQLHELSELFFTDSNNNPLKPKAIHFKREMIRELKVLINKTLETFDKQFKVKLLPSFKWKAHIYTLIKFSGFAVKIQEKWDLEHNPLQILMNKKKDYTELIENRLKFGFSFDSEGRILAYCILRAALSKAKTAAEKKLIDTVLDLTWIRNSETVRLKYFKKLANEVRQGSNTNAVKHFTRPQSKVEKWFKREVDSNCDKVEIKVEIKRKLEETFLSEIRYIIQEIRNANTVNDLINYIELYLKEVGDIDYKRGVNASEASINDLETLRNCIEKELNTDPLKMCANVIFKLLSNEDAVMDRMGCTFTCHFCGAICWGQRGHHQNSDHTRKHHSCHQPCGLAGFHDVETKKLAPEICHEYNHTLRVNCGYCGIDDLVSWSVISNDSKHNNWQYMIHHNNKFNELMCWFFVKLNSDIAIKQNVKLTNNDDLKSRGWLKLNSRFDSIMASIEQKIN